ncbi:MAG: hypothetical protein HGA28_04870 [Anaerolineaceae bacterium]|nr:hypothetical protein [Anaerolineaceae bacterium]
MKSQIIDHRYSLPFLGVIAVFVVSRIVYDQAGIQFQGDTYLGYWQFIDPVLLRDDLWRSILYLHSQPPLFNLTTGLVLQIFPAAIEEAFHLLFFTTGLILAAAILLLGFQLRLPPWLCLPATAWFMISPGTILYEHWFTYSYPVTALLTLSGVLLHEFIRTEKVHWGILFFTSAALIALTWSLFHITWLIGIFVILFISSPNRKKLLRVALLPILFVAGWYAKNLVLVGEFTANSWMGMNVSRISTYRLPQKERKEMVASGKLSNFALLPPFRNPTAYLELLPDTPETGIPVLDLADTSLGRRNHNHLVYVEASGYYLRDALRTILAHPDVYLRGVLQSFYIWFHSTSDFELTEGNRAKIHSFERWWNRLFYGQWESEESSGNRVNSMSAAHMGWLILTGYATAFVGGFGFLWTRRGQITEPGNMLILFMLYNILFVSLVGNLMDLGENNRIRYAIDPFVWILYVFLIRPWIRRVSERVRHARSAVRN